MLANLNNPQSPSYANLKGQIKGKVTKVMDNKIYIEPTKGGQAIFSLSPTILVSEFKDGKMTELGKDKNAIKIGENALITISGYNNGFAVNAISYVSGNVPVTGQMKEINQ
jgi:enamine deaminase RidA (YjgF/YER057c/UK114 family)